MPQPPPPTAADWEKHRDLITDLYVRQGWTQKQIADKMLAQHGFRASEKMFVSRFLKWAINKRMRPEDAIAIIHATSRRVNAGRRVLKLRLRGREVSEQEARTSLRRRNHVSIPAPEKCGPPTPSDISIDSEDEEDAHHIPSAVDDEANRAFLSNAAVAQRPASPCLVGYGRSDVFLLQKMRDWRLGGYAGDERTDMAFGAYLTDLLNVQYLPCPASNRRTLWTLSRLKPALETAFERNGVWLLCHLVFLTAHLSVLPPHCDRLLQYVRATLTRAARTTTSGAREHPLLVLCCSLMDENLQYLDTQILRCCSAFSLETFGVISVSHEIVERLRSKNLQHRGEWQEAESALVNVAEALEYGNIEQRSSLGLTLDLANLYRRRRKFANAETTLLDVLQNCARVSLELDLPFHLLEQPYPSIYLHALCHMYRLRMDQQDFASAQDYARQSLLHSEQALGTSDIWTINIFHDLMGCLEHQEKWDEVGILWREWRDVIEPPGFFELEPGALAGLEADDDKGDGSGTTDDQDGDGTVFNDELLGHDTWTQVHRMFD